MLGKMLTLGKVFFDAQFGLGSVLTELSMGRPFGIIFGLHAFNMRVYFDCNLQRADLWPC